MNNCTLCKRTGFEYPQFDVDLFQTNWFTFSNIIPVNSWLWKYCKYAQQMFNGKYINKQSVERIWEPQGGLKSQAEQWSFSKLWFLVIVRWYSWFPFRYEWGWVGTLLYFTYRPIIDCWVMTDTSKLWLVQFLMATEFLSFMWSVQMRNSSFGNRK